MFKQKVLIHELNYSINSNMISIMRDDLLSFTFGGNKLRIALEYYNDMLTKGKDCIISYGDEKSNLNRAIANLIKLFKVECYIVIPTDKLSSQGSFNKRILENLGVNIVY